MAEEHRVSAHLEAVYPGIASKVLKQRQDEAHMVFNQPNSSLLQRLVSDLHLLFADLELPLAVHPVLSPYQLSIKDLASLDSTVVDSIRLVQALHRDLYALNIKSDLQNAVPFTMKETSLKRRKMRLYAEKHLRQLSPYLKHKEGHQQSKLTCLNSSIF